LAVHPDIVVFDEQLQTQSRSLSEALSKLPEDRIDAVHTEVRKKLGPKEQEYDHQLFEKLRAWRSELARTKKLPAYIIFDDKTLRNLAADKPHDLDSLLKVSGVGPAKSALYGEQLLGIISSHG